jgi:hypothetical protein
MNPMPVVVGSEFTELSHQVGRVPEECAIKQLAPNRANQALNERMRDWRIGDRLDVLDFTHAQVGQPSVKAKQRVVIGADALRGRVVGDGAVEHAADRNPVDASGLNAKADEAARENVHHHHDPVTAQDDGFASEEVNTPQAVLGGRETSAMTEYPFRMSEARNV